MATVSNLESKTVSQETSSEIENQKLSSPTATSKNKTEENGAAAEPPTKRLKTAKAHDDDNDDTDDENAAAATTLERVQSKLRTFKRIPIFIVDYHNDVLEFIYRCLASRHLPLEKNVLIHFDSHPDMVISRDISASSAYDKETMLDELSIENWIMPTLYTGHFNRVVWLKNSWCKQIPTGTHNFKIGHKDDKIGVDCALDYFIADGNYCASEELQEARNIELQVHDADNEDLDPTKFLTEDDQHSFILDIDLDFFSTSNPFLEIYADANCYTHLKDIFHFDSVEAQKKDSSDYCAAAGQRQKQLEALKNVFCELEEKRIFNGLSSADAAVLPENTHQKIEKLVADLHSQYPDDEIDWLLIFDSGSTADNNGLPHHISTPKELEQYFGNFKRFLHRLPIAPVAITMAHSAQDDYCPMNQVQYIEQQVLQILREEFGDELCEKPILHYMDDEWDIMQL